MKIHFSTYDSISNPHYAGGGAKMIHEIARKLAAKGYTVTVICGSYKGAVNSSIDGVYYKHIGFRNSGPRLGQLIYLFILPFFAVREKYDIWLESFTPPISTGFIPLFTTQPVIGITTLLNAQDFSRKYKLPFRILEQIGLKFYKYIISLNQNLAEKIRHSNKVCQIETIPGGIKKSYSPLMKTKELNYVLYLGRLDIFQKGLDLLINIADYVCRDIKNIKFVIAGSGNHRETDRLKKLIDRSGLTKKFILTGQVEGKLKEKLLANTLMGINCSRFESFGLTALEFMACGKPFVCFDLEGFSWIPDQYAVKIKSFDAISFSGKVIRLCQDSHLRNILSINGKQFARSFDYQKISDRYEEFILKVTNQQARPVIS